MSNQISLRIHSVKCVDETGGKTAEKFGNDEIMLSGFGIDAGANTVKVDPFEIYPHFDDGETKRFSPPRKFVTLNLTNNSSFPKSYSVGFLLAERDNGDLGSKLEKVFAKLNEEVEKKRKEEEEKKRRAGGASLTGAVALTGAEVAVIWAVVQPIIFDWIKNKIISAANDDIFPPRDATITISSANFTFDGSNVSTQFPVEFRGHDGVYRMTCDWELS